MKLKDAMLRGSKLRKRRHARLALAKAICAISIGLGSFALNACGDADPTKNMTPAEAKAALKPAFDSYLEDVRMAQHSWEYKAEMCRQWRYVVQLARASGDPKTADAMLANNDMGGGEC